jgi:hypothetical protein
MEDIEAGLMTARAGRFLPTPASASGLAMTWLGTGAFLDEND